MEMLTQNVKLYKKMRNVATQQESSLRQDRMDQFLQLAKQRERIRSQISANDKRRRSLPKEPSMRRQGQEAGSLATEIRDLIQSIQEIDRKTEEFVLQQREAMITEMQGLRRGQKALRSYGGKASTGAARFIEKSG